jgi:hypothetical protein
MPLVIEVPTHLNVEDTLVLNLTARQLARVAAFASLAYALWDQAPALPVGLRTVFAALLVLVGLLLALVQPGGRSLDHWAFAALAYSMQPRRLGWRRPEPEPGAMRTSGLTDWAELTPRVGWRSTDEWLEHKDDEEPTQQRPLLRRRCW